ncbi:MAG: DNA-directed RNA polymerase subunit beta, partial [Candidatus Omnitrophota bacterium]
MLKRKNFGKLKDIIEMPNLLDIQLCSFHDFLQQDVARTRRKNEGLQEVFSEMFPIESHDKQYRLEYVCYSIEKPKYGVLECLRRGLTYASPLKVVLRLRSKKETKEQEVYFGELPLMTETGTFIINGDERVAVSQLHRSPGVSFEEELQPNGKKVFSARLIPYRGAWLEFELDTNGILHVTIDRRRKIIATSLLRAIGFASDEDILKKFCGVEEVKIETKHNLNALEGRVVAKDVIEGENKQLLLPKRHRLSKEVIDRLAEYDISKIAVLKEEIPEILLTLEKDHTKTQEDALLDIFRRIRPGDPVTMENAKGLLDKLFFDPRRYDLGKVGRYILNRKLKMSSSLDERILDKDTIVNVITSLVKLKNGQGDTDDIDHLGNRRIRTVGELLQNQFRIGLARMERSARERMAIYDVENALPHNLINSKLVSSVIRDFFGRSQLSQFMDQTNPLAEMTHKRRLSALGPGGLSRERAGFEVRDVHHSHYGRICPIETPEGPNIGLIASLSTYAKINEFGFIETPYRRVRDSRATGSIEYLSADIEDQHIVAQANARIDETGRFLDKHVSCRHKGDFPIVQNDKIDYMDVSPRQLVSVAASLIPFLEHDDANRALMGSNMQRQAVPLLFPEPPLIGTGVEYKTAKDSGASVGAKNSGTVRSVQSDEIVVGDTTYKLRKFMRSNASTCINQRPIVSVGDKIKEGDVIADGTATADGELSLGRNILVAFMPWRGYNFEDAILISERLVRDDLFTSLHIEEFEIEARETRLGNEEITADIPNVSEDALKNLDQEGIVRLGAEVGPGDILVGKVTPKSEAELSPEERLLRAIFGE